MERRTFTEEYKQAAVRMVEDEGRSKLQVARECGICTSQLYRWLERYGREHAIREQLAADAQVEVLILRQELTRVTAERDLLRRIVGLLVHTDEIE